MRWETDHTCAAKMLHPQVGTVHYSPSPYCPSPSHPSPSRPPPYLTPRPRPGGERALKVQTMARSDLDYCMGSTKVQGNYEPRHSEGPGRAAFHLTFVHNL